jgi:hypothetical protein
MNSATTSSAAAAAARPRLGATLLVALVLGGLVAAGAYAQRAGALSPSNAGLAQSAAARAQLAGILISETSAPAKHRLAVWHAPRVPRVHPRVVTPPPHVVIVPAPAPALAAAPVPVASQTTASARPAAHGDDGGGPQGGGDD